MYTTLRTHPIFSEYSGYKVRDYRNVLTLIDQLAEVGCSVRSGNAVLTSGQIQAFVFEAFIREEHFRTAINFLEQAIDFMDWYKSKGYWFEAVQPPSLNELCTMFGFNADVPREFRDESNPAVRPENSDAACLKKLEFLKSIDHLPEAVETGEEPEPVRPEWIYGRPTVIRGKM
jgi:hypothetical protein